MKKALLTISIIVLALTMLHGTQTTAATTSPVSVDSQLTQFFATHLGAKMPVVITYRQMPGSAEFTRLQSAGILKGFALRTLPMVIADMNALQLSAVRRQPGVVSIYSNRVLHTYTNVSRHFIGIPGLTRDVEVMTNNATNPNSPSTGRGIGIGYLDTGIDGTHQDLTYGTKTVQNVIQPLSHGVVSDAGLVLGVGISIADLIAGTGFVPPIYVENQPHSDLESGHGTHGAAVAAGTGAASNGFYGGMARGAHLVGVNIGNEMGLPTVGILGGYDYLLANQFQYNIRVINNSWGGGLDAEGVDPNNPINIATRTAHDRNITVVFAAGNAGDTPTSINPYSTMPWTISVAAGEKQGLGSPADFSSRGVDNGTGTDVAGMPADEQAKPNLRPDITAPGVDIKSARMKGPGLTNTLGTVPVVGNDLTTIPPAFLPFYTTSQGTSFACPHVSGVVALMLEANPQLTPDEVVTKLRETANPMPFPERVVGAGYVDAHNAVRAALGLAQVPHAYSLFPVAGGPEIVDVVNDQSGTGAQDIQSVDFAYDAAANQIVYTLTVADLSSKVPNSYWTVNSKFGTHNVFVSASVTESGAMAYEYGEFETLPNGGDNQVGKGAPTSAEVAGNRIIIRLAVSNINAIVGANANIVGTTSTQTAAKSQILIGTSASGGLLLNADSATGSDFKVE